MSKHKFFKPRFGKRGDSATLPAEYIEEHMEDEDLSPAVVSPPLKYVSRINSFATEEAAKELERNEESLFGGAKEDLRLLRESVVQYQQKTNTDSSSDIAINGAATSWKAVREAVQLAKAREDGQDSDSWSARDSCEKISNNISALETWLDLLPGGDYGAVVSGVFKMVVGAAKRAQDVRAIVFKALADIPYWVGRANRYRDLYAESRPRELAQMTAQLCSAVLVALRHVMIYFTEGTLKKAWKAMAQGQAYRQTLVGHLDRVKDLIEKVDQEAAVSSQYRLKDLEKRCQNLSMELKDVKDQITEGVPIDEATKVDLSARIGAVAAENVLNTLYSHFSSNPSIDGRIRDDVPSRLLEAPPSPLPAKSLTPRESISTTAVLLALKSSQALPQQELKRCLTTGTSLSLPNQDHVKWTMQSRQLHEWLLSPKSRTFLINGNGEANETFSFTTFLSAKLLEGLGKMEPIISLHYFCSLHMTFREDIKDDAVGLVKSFIVQLLPRNIPWDLSFLSTEDFEKIEHDDLATICTLLRRLIQQLPSPTFLFWMIDGINYYERSQRRPDFLTVIHEFLSIMKDCDHVIIKLLLTCHSKSAYVKDDLGKEDILTVPSTIDGSRQGWSERTFQNSLGHDLEQIRGAKEEDHV